MAGNRHLCPRSAEAALLLLVLFALTVLYGCVGSPWAWPFQAPSAGKATPTGTAGPDLSPRWADRLTPRSLLFKGGQFAARYGLDVRYLMYSSGGEARDDLIAGGLDLAEVGARSALAGLVQAPDSLVIVGLSGYGGDYAVAVRQDSAYRALRDLAGRSLAVRRGSGCFAALAQWASGQGLDLQRDFRLVDLGETDAVDALLAGRVEAIAYWQPLTNLLVGSGRAREIASFAGATADPVFLLARAGYAGKNPEAVAAFLAAWADADQALAANPQGAAEMGARELAAQGLSLPAEVYARSLTTDTRGVWLTPEARQAAVDLLSAMQQDGAIARDASIDWRKAWRPDYGTRAQEMR